MKKLILSICLCFSISSFAVSSFTRQLTFNGTAVTVPWTNVLGVDALPILASNIGTNLVNVPCRLDSLTVISTGYLTNGWLFVYDAAASNDVQYGTAPTSYTNYTSYITWLTFTTNWTQVTNTYATSGAHGSGGTNAFQTNYISGVYTVPVTNAAHVSARRLVYQLFIPSNSVTTVSLPTTGVEFGLGVSATMTNGLYYTISGTYTPSR